MHNEYLRVYVLATKNDTSENEGEETMSKYKFDIAGIDSIGTNLQGKTPDDFKEELVDFFSEKGFVGGNTKKRRKKKGKKGKKRKTANRK